MSKKIVIAGNSVGVRIRPFESGDKSYSDLLRTDNHHVVNLCSSGEMIGTFSLGADKIVREYPDVIVLQFGIVELSSRSTSRRMYDYLHYKAKRTHVGNFLKFVISGVESKMRRLLVYLRFQRSWYRLSRFLAEYDHLLNQLEKSTDAKIICLGINTPNDRVEKQLPGSRNRVAKANEELPKIVKRYTKCHFVSVNDMETTEYPDGIHYNAAGHRNIYDQILESI